MKKLISVILAVVILATAVTVGFTVFATEDPDPTETTQPTEQTVYTPAKVKGLKASDITTTSLNLTWKQSTYATKYLVYRASEGDNGTIGDYKKIASLPGIANTSYSDTKLKAGRVYKYQVYSYRNKNGVITKSEPTSLVTMTYPSAVSNLKIKSKTVSSLTLGWSKVTKCSQYLVYKSSKDSNGVYGEYKLIKRVASSQTSYKNTKLKSGTFYKYKVIVKRTKEGISRKSDEVGVKGMTKLASPKNFRNKKATSKSITLAWEKSTGAKKYILYRKPAGSGSYKKIKTTNKTSYKDTGVSSGANYTYRIRAYTKVAGKSYYSDYSKLSTSTAVVSVKGVKAKSYLKRALFTWKSVSGASGYDVFMKASNGSYKLKGTTSYPRFLSGKLKSGKVYSFSIKAFKKVNGQKVYGTAKYVKVKIKATAYGKKPKGTWVEVCTETQTLYMYVKNKLYLSTPVVTGNYGALATTPGYHHVLSKQSPSRLRGSYGGSSWDVTVNYWLGFTGDGQGIHDSTWRGAYGGDIYKGDGSHGCVNTPLDKVAKIYKKAYVGMPVIVY